MNVLLLAGGNSAEREISLLSGENVRQALVQNDHQILMIDPAHVDLTEFDASGFDVAFIALHGTFGEDGQLQQLLEQRQIPFTGCDSNSSRLCFDKALARDCFQKAGVRIPSGISWSPADGDIGGVLKQYHLAFPLFIKPARQGSSLGVSRVETAEELSVAILLALTFDEKLVIEQAVAGQEWTLAVWNDLPFPLLEIKPAASFYDYRSKYEDQNTEWRIAEDLPQKLETELREQASKACQAGGVNSLVRVDMMLDDQGRAWVLEINTIPGLTAHSCVPKAAAHLGISMTALCERLCVEAFNNSSDRRQLYKC